jgi:hypothetical protein
LKKKNLLTKYVRRNYILELYPDLFSDFTCGVTLEFGLVACICIFVGDDGRNNFSYKVQTCKIFSGHPCEPYTV